MNKSNLTKKYQLSPSNKIKYILSNSDFSLVGVHSIGMKEIKFYTIEYFIDNLIRNYEGNFDKNQDFLFTINLEPQIIDELRRFLIKHKKFVVDYVSTGKISRGSHVYQAYLQYIPFILTDREKNIFLNSYINMVDDLRGTDIAKEKRKRLECTLNID